MQPYNPYMINPYMQQAIVPPMMQQQHAGTIKVSGRDEAMNRLLMMYPANMLVPGFVSEAVFDINGHQFHALSIESDGSRNLETFDYQLHVDQPTSGFVSRAEFQSLVDRLDKITGGNDGIPESVQPPAAGQQPQ